MRDDSRDEVNCQIFDAVIIGGGINGAGVARDAALRGLKVCLFEKADFASGTSSKSTKIAHGGLRYLRNFEFGLVREAQLERRWLRQMLPHLVEPLSFCYPVYRDGPDPFWKVKLGINVYDLLDGRRQPHQTLTAEETLAANPSLRKDGLLGSLRYWDDRMDDARVCLETILSAEEAGARCFNYTKVVGVERLGQGFEVTTEDSLQSQAKPTTVRCRALVNCGGPWADSILRTIGGSQGSHLIPTKGVHVLVPRLAGSDALVLENARDKRTFFAIPWQDQTLIGTTDTRFLEEPDTVGVGPEDVQYLLDAARDFVPGAQLSAEDVEYSFAGLRPLVSPTNASVAEGKISRKHLILREPRGVITLVGGKFTTFRQMAEETVTALLQELALRPRASSTRTAPYFKSSGAGLDDGRDDGEEELRRSLVERYGPRAGSVLEVCQSSEMLRQPFVEGQPVRLGELPFAIKHERVRLLSDFLERRTHLAWNMKQRDVAKNLDALESFLDPSILEDLRSCSEFQGFVS